MNKILISLMAGIGIGILIAPASGTDTRRKLVRRFKTFTEELKDEADDLYASGKGLVDQVKTEVNELVQDVKQITKPV